MESESATSVSFADDVGDANRWPVEVAVLHQCTGVQMTPFFPRTR